MSMSAPSAINTEFTTVRFDDDTTEWNNIASNQTKSAMSHRYKFFFLQYLPYNFLLNTNFICALIFFVCNSFDFVDKQEIEENSDSSS